MSTTLGSQPHLIVWARTPIFSLVDGPNGPEHDISRILITYAQISLPNARADVSSRARGLSFWSGSSSSSILCVCEQRRLGRVCTYAQTRPSVHCSIEIPCTGPNVYWLGHRPVNVRRAAIGSKGVWRLCTIYLSCKVFHDWSIIKLGNILYLLDGYIFAVLYETTSHCFC